MAVHYAGQTPAAGWGLIIGLAIDLTHDLAHGANDAVGTGGRPARRKRAGLDDGGS
jgi:hypothetical protein